MKKSKKNSLPPFEPITSIPLTLINYSFGLLLMLPILFLIMAVFIFVKEDNTIAAVCVLLSLFSAVILIIVHAVDIWKKIYTTIRIDEKGIHYLNKFNGKTIDKIAWNQITKRKVNPNDFYKKQYDITAVLPYRGIHAYFIFEILIDKQIILRKEIFHSNHIFFLLFCNRLELIRTFLLGLSNFRSDLTIDPDTFEDHFIDPETFIINYKKKTKYSILISIIILLFVIFIWLLIDFCK